MADIYFHRIVGALIAVLCLTGQPSLPEAAEKMIELTVSGDPGQEITGDCYLVQRPGKDRRHRIQGRVPTRFLLPAESVRCNLQKSRAKGRLIATIIRNGTKEMTQQSRYPFRWIAISSAGPWGMARGGTSAARPIFR